MDPMFQESGPYQHLIRVGADYLTVDEAKALHSQLERAIKDAFEHDKLCHNPVNP